MWKKGTTRFFLFCFNIIWTFVSKQYLHTINKHIQKGPWNLRSANGDLLIHRNLANSGTKGKRSEITFMLSTSIDSVFTIKNILQLTFCAYCDLKIFYPLLRLMEMLCVFYLISAAVSAFYVPGIVLGTRSRAVNRNCLLFMEFTCK